VKCNYVCSLVLRQTLADCDTVASSKCLGIKTENGNLCEEGKYELLGTTKKWRKATVSFVNHFRLSVLSYETAFLPMEELPWNFKMRWCVKSVEKIPVWLKSNKQRKYLPKQLLTFISTLGTGIVMISVVNNTY
jgi:hypothetical protein